LTRPTRRRAYGDGSELDGFDDLVTSKDQEVKGTRQPRESLSTHFLRSSRRESGDLRKHFSAQNLSGHKLEQVSTPEDDLSPPRQVTRSKLC